MSNKLYEKIETLCQRINLYTEKDTSVKNEVKTTLYITKINKLINMIETVENDTYIPREIINVKDRISSDSNDTAEGKYNPYSENFYYKDKLEQLDGDINKLIEELKEEDKMGYRNAYIIGEIEKSIKDKKESVKVVNISNHGKKNENLVIKDKMSFLEKIKSIFKFRK